MGNILTGKKIVVMGVANKRPIAWGRIQMMAEQGAQVIYTYQNSRTKKGLQRLVDDGGQLIECDVTDDESIDQAFTIIKERFTKVDGIVHVIAFAKRGESTGLILGASRKGYAIAQDISSYSLTAVTKVASELNLLNNSANIVILTYFDSERTIPNYNVMGIAKAALEAGVRYLARNLGQKRIRVNAISAGAVKILAVTGIKGHDELLKMSQARTIDGEDVTISEIGNVCVFLVSDLSVGITGDTIYVNKGVHLI